MLIEVKKCKAYKLKKKIFGVSAIDKLAPNVTHGKYKRHREISENYITHKNHQIPFINLNTHYWKNCAANDLKEKFI